MTLAPWMPTEDRQQLSLALKPVVTSKVLVRYRPDEGDPLRGQFVELEREQRRQYGLAKLTKDRLERR